VLPAQSHPHRVRLGPFVPARPARSRLASSSPAARPRDRGAHGLDRPASVRRGLGPRCGRCPRHPARLHRGRALAGRRSWWQLPSSSSTTTMPASSAAPAIAADLVTCPEFELDLVTSRRRSDRGEPAELELDHQPVGEFGRPGDHRRLVASRRPQARSGASRRARPTRQSPPTWTSRRARAPPRAGRRARPTRRSPPRGPSARGYMPRVTERAKLSPAACRMRRFRARSPSGRGRARSRLTGVGEASRSQQAMSACRSAW
jgi:hypothetical protein